MLGEIKNLTGQLADDAFLFNQQFQLLVLIRLIE
jgi:hypothetical protein